MFKQKGWGKKNHYLRQHLKLTSFLKLEWIQTISSEMCICVCKMTPGAKGFCCGELSTFQHKCEHFSQNPNFHEYHWGIAIVFLLEQIFQINNMAHLLVLRQIKVCELLSLTCSILSLVLINPNLPAAWSSVTKQTFQTSKSGVLEDIWNTQENSGFGTFPYALNNVMSQHCFFLFLFTAWSSN